MSRLGGMNARDVHMLLDGKVDPRIVKVFMAQAERQDHLYGLMEQMAHAVDQLASSQLAQAQAVHVLKDAHDKAKQARAGLVKVESEAAQGQESGEP